MTALETYFGDTLFKAVMGERTQALERLIEGIRDLNKEKFTLTDIISSRDIVAEKVTDYLRHSILYHDLPRVDCLYRAALDVHVLGEKAENDKLLKAIEYRHDCVHRNGRDNEGNQLTVFTKAYIEEIAAVMRSLVDRIDRAIHG